MAAPQRNSLANGGSAWRRTTLLVLALTLLAPGGPALAEIYKCRTADGRIEIANTPCASGSGTVSMRPDEAVSDEAREQVERDIERMRGFVDRREAELRREAAAEQQRQVEEERIAATRRVYAAENMDDCLAELGRQPLPAARQAELEAICRAKANDAPVMIGVPVYGGVGSPVDTCVARVMRLRLAPAEQQRRIAQCQGGSVVPPVRPPLQPPVQPSNKPPVKPLKPCPRDDRYCVR